MPAAQNISFHPKYGTEGIIRGDSMRRDTRPSFNRISFRAPKHNNSRHGIIPQINETCGYSPICALCYFGLIYLKCLAKSDALLPGLTRCFQGLFRMPWREVEGNRYLECIIYEKDLKCNN
ncbi:hypothetical protein CEXT_422791 [Caerostris extrusa]|uniref:Uncharacterized protein n=1 Tax=Caerostris extrusa TaxID=172846 RepID=A0AAV4V4P6_CAEEX|nr:hypothetical protein CEXT_422791 [Caerostris extrusa]